MVSGDRGTPRAGYAVSLNAFAYYSSPRANLTMAAILPTDASSDETLTSKDGLSATLSAPYTTIRRSAQGAIVGSKLRDRLESVMMQKGAIAGSLARIRSRIQGGADMVLAYADLLHDPAELYDTIVDSAKRDLLGALFDRIDVLVSDDDLQIWPQGTSINEALHEWTPPHSFNPQPEASE